MKIFSKDNHVEKQRTVNLLLAITAGQAGCITLAVVLVATFGGLWLDGYYHTKPVITIILLLVSVPVSIFLMLFVVRNAVTKIKSLSEKTPDTN